MWHNSIELACCERDALGLALSWADPPPFFVHHPHVVTVNILSGPSWLQMCRQARCWCRDGGSCVNGIPCAGRCDGKDMSFCGTAMTVVRGIVSACLVQEAITATLTRSALAIFGPDWARRILRNEGEVSAHVCRAAEAATFREALSPLNAHTCVMQLCLPK